MKRITRKRERENETVLLRRQSTIFLFHPTIYKLGIFDVNTYSLFKLLQCNSNDSYFSSQLFFFFVYGILKHIQCDEVYQDDVQWDVIFIVHVVIKWIWQQAVLYVHVKHRTLAREDGMFPMVDHYLNDQKFSTDEQNFSVEHSLIFFSQHGFCLYIFDFFSLFFCLYIENDLFQ